MQPNSPLDQTRLRWVDLIRALGAFLVVMAHFQYVGRESALTAALFYALTRIAVPLFFMASGFLLLAKNESYQDFFRKRVLKIAVPLVVWSLIYLLWRQEGFGKPLFEIAKSYLVKIVRGPRESHLWFLYELFGLYLFTPILRLYAQRAAIRDLLYFCVLWFLLNPTLQLIQEFTPLRVGFTYYFLGGYIGYFIFGYLVSRLQLSRRHWLGAVGVFFAAGIATVVAMYVSRSYGQVTQYFEDYLSVNVVLMSAALFIVFTRFHVSDSPARVVLPLSHASFGIYLAHVLVLTELFSKSPFLELTAFGNALYMIPLLSVLGFVVTFLLVFILQRIPMVKYCVP